MPREFTSPDPLATGTSSSWGCGKFSIRKRSVPARRVTAEGGIFSGCGSASVAMETIHQRSVGKCAQGEGLA